MDEQRGRDRKPRTDALIGHRLAGAAAVQQRTEPRKPAHRQGPTGTGVSGLQSGTISGWNGVERCPDGLSVEQRTTGPTPARSGRR